MYTVTINLGPYDTYEHARQAARKHLRTRTKVRWNRQPLWNLGWFANIKNLDVKKSK